MNFILHLNIKLNNCVFAAGSILNHLAKRGEFDCDGCLKPGWAKAFVHVFPSCGCEGDIAALNVTCRDLNAALVPNQITWSYYLTCKQTAADSCKTSVDEFAKSWIKAPKDEDKVCADFYKGTQIMANSCN